MFIIEKPGSHISGVFQQYETALAFYKQIPKAEKQKLRQPRDLKHFPFFIMEKTKGKFEYFQYRKEIKIKKFGTLYTITKDWQPPGKCAPGSDAMGYLDHEHDGYEETEIEAFK